MPQGAKCQAFLANTTAGFAGMLQFSGGQWTITNAPAFNLPLLNPAVDSAYPLPSSWTHLMVATGEPGAWKFLRAPTAGTHIVRAKNGAFELVDAGSIPGINEIGQSGLTTVKGKIQGIVETEAGVWSMRTVLPVHKRVLVGDVDGSGLTGHKSLPDADDLEHPKAKITAMRIHTLETLDVSGNTISGGLEQAVVTGIGAVTDGVRMLYSPTTKRIYKAPANLNTFVANTTVTSAFLPTTSFASMPSGHGAGVPHNFNYAEVDIDFAMYTNADEVFSVGLFRDGTLLQEWLNTSTADTYVIFYTDTGVVPGSHTYEFRIKKTTGSNNMIIRSSFFRIQNRG